jgi:hypothetical protein
MDRPESSIVVPRTYRPWSRTWGIVYGIWVSCLIAGDWWAVLFGTKKPSLSDFIFLYCYLLIAGAFTFVFFRDFVRLSKDSIEVCRLWGNKALPFAKIKGRRSYTERADPYSTPPRHLVLEPNDERYPRIDIRIKKDNDRFDESFYRWFDSLPDLDKLDGLEPSQSKYSNFSLV